MHHINRVNIASSPSFSAFYNHYPATLTCDSGATSSLIRHSFALKCNMPISPTTHTASQADGKTKLTPCGEVHITLSRGAVKLPLDALVVKELDTDVLVGMPFMKANNIRLDIANDKISLGKETIHYKLKSLICSASRICRSQSFLLRASAQSVVLPGEFLQVKSPEIYQRIQK